MRSEPSLRPIAGKAPAGRRRYAGVCREPDMNPDEPQVPSLVDPLLQAALERIMDDGELPGQLDEVHRTWPESRDAMLLLAEAIELRLTVRGVSICARVPYDTWPRHPPDLRVVDASMVHPNIQRNGEITGLSAQTNWNRTVTLADLLRELERRFVDHPPRRGLGLRRLLDPLHRMLRGRPHD